MSLNQQLEQHVHEQDVDFVGVTTVAPFYIGVDRREIDPLKIMPEAKSLVVTAFYTYIGEERTLSEPGTPRGRFGPWTRLSMRAVGYQQKVVTSFFEERGFAAKAVGELPAKPSAVRAGIARYGKNGITHAPGAGSYIKFATVLTDAELDTVELPIETSDCGECDECIKACPTAALDNPFRVDWSHCVCAWLWGRVQPACRDLRHAVGDHIHRCSYCQDACPLNHNLTPRASVPFELEGTTCSPELLPLLNADDEAMNAVLPAFVMSAGANTIRRNIAIALGNIGDAAAVPVLAQALQHEDPQVRAHAAWALGEIGGCEASSTLEQGLASENEESVKEEIQAALEM